MSISEIQVAKQADVDKISKVILSVWPDSSISYERIIGVLNDPIHSTMVAVIEGEVVGFVDGFLTISQEGIKRWEVDLLAVQPDFQGKGIATQLIAANMAIGQTMGAEMSRGLVAVGNTGSEKAFLKCGYEKDSFVCDLMISSDPRRMFEASANDESHPIAVRTINYVGLWVEGKRTYSDLVQALRQFSIGKYDLVGLVVPNADEQVSNDAMSLGFERVGRFHWWQRPLKSITENEKL